MIKNNNDHILKPDRGSVEAADIFTDVLPTMSNLSLLNIRRCFPKVTLILLFFYFLITLYHIGIHGTTKLMES